MTRKKSEETIVANTPQSRKQKGRKFQQYVRDKLLEYFPILTEKDVRSTSMGASGTDLLLSQKAFDIFKHSVECKNQEKLNIWKSLEQAESEARDGEPILIFKRNRSKVYCAMDFNYYLELVKKLDEYENDSDVT